MGASSPPKPPKPPPPPPPVDQQVDELIERNRSRRRQAALALGRPSTILTSGAGVAEPATLGRKSILGSG